MSTSKGQDSQPAVLVQTASTSMSCWYTGRHAVLCCTAQGGTGVPSCCSGAVGSSPSGGSGAMTLSAILAISTCKYESEPHALLMPYCWESCQCSHWGKTPMQWKKTQNILGKYYLPVHFNGEESILVVAKNFRVSSAQIGLGYFWLAFEVMLMLHHHFQCSGWQLIARMASHL